MFFKGFLVSITLHHKNGIFSWPLEPVEIALNLTVEAMAEQGLTERRMPRMKNTPHSEEVKRHLITKHPFSRRYFVSFCLVV